MDELKNIAPRLSKLKKEIPFGTPDKYFDDFSARLQVKLETEKKVVSIQQNRLIRFMKPAIGLAAAFALIFMLVYWPLNNFMSKQVANNMVEQDLNEMEYLNMVEGIDENSFFTILEATSSSTELTDADLESYLVANVSEYEIFNETSYN